ncbi:uncharacterized protein K452DRAFT_302080 [Aplosporella prunicola CBS 121167]|uniref:RGS domain-containing protein n=1 Tax=Aplosporella prunicola CBS 121167 TaxID=1176127 RepID=A0A6A6B1S4_9PEZI|nr:uncharacterized protein K452DRAFT_302080 [Aplosporella prunicola CBS 121167]KAF2137323.1 hypothetical protein K452DRAFT_302080 [Aplosporella prunicola CBS 121167]
MSILFYRRPSFVERPDGPLNGKACQRMVERTQNGRRAIPDELSFENIMSNKALPPCSLNDFMDYLVYISHDAENLQFHLWLQDYTQRFSALKPESKALAPEWKDQSAPPEEKAAQVAAPRGRGWRRANKPGPLVPKIDFDKPSSDAAEGDIGLTEIVVMPAKEGTSPSPSRTTFATTGLASPLSPNSTFEDAYNNRTVTPDPREPRLSHRASQPLMTEESVRELKDEANTQAGLKWDGFSVQPFRAEIDRVIAHYIAPGSPRELNLSARDRAAVLHALQHTTHPSAFTAVAAMVEATLRGQSHPNFVRWAICNGNQPRVFFVRTMGVTHIAGGLLIGIILALSSASRWYRLLMFPVLFLGITTMIAAYKGLCVILHKTHTRNVKPWEDARSLNSGITGAEGAGVSTAEADAQTLPPCTPTTPNKPGPVPFDYDEEATLAGSPARSAKHDSWGSAASSRRSDAFGPANEWETEDWVARYKRRSLRAKVFDAQTWVQEESVRVVQDRIVRQSQAWSLLLTAAATAAVVAVPGGGFF